MSDAEDDERLEPEFERLGEDEVRRNATRGATPEHWRRAAFRWLGRQNVSRVTADTEHRENERLITQWTRIVGIFTVVLAATGLLTLGILYRTDETSRLGRSRLRLLRRSSDYALSDF